MIDKQQIEEMALTLNYLCKSGCGTCYSKEYCGTYKIAEALYNAGYRKVPENVVVLMEEEYNALMLEQKRLKEIVDRIPCGYELKDEIRKETAKEILDKVSRHYGGAWLVELYKEYGVEVD